MKLTLTALLGLAACNVSANFEDYQMSSNSITECVQPVATTTMQLVKDAVIANYGKLALAGAGIAVLGTAGCKYRNAIKASAYKFGNFVKNHPYISGSLALVAGAGVLGTIYKDQVIALAQDGYGKVPSMEAVTSYVPSTETVKGYVPSMETVKGSIQKIGSAAYNAARHPVTTAQSIGAQAGVMATAIGTAAGTSVYKVYSMLPSFRTATDVTPVTEVSTRTPVAMQIDPAIAKRARLQHLKDTLNNLGRGEQQAAQAEIRQLESELA